MPATEGETRVVYGFNPSAHPEVQSMKARCAALIDDILAIGYRTSADRHTKRWAAKAATNIETASMYAVKAITHEGSDYPIDHEETPHNYDVAARESAAEAF